MIDTVQSELVRSIVEKHKADDARRMAASYSTRGNANKAARTLCKKIFGAAYCAFEGPDYHIHPVTLSVWSDLGERYMFRLVGHSKDEAERLNIRC